jgi:ribosome biogenesis GTPase / thiamine phosphate phosphatase
VTQTSLEEYGFVPFFAQQATADELQQGLIARVTEVQRSLVIVFDGFAERPVELAPALQEAAPEQRPTVGDWVTLDHKRSRAERVLERKSVFTRLAPGRKTGIQLIAANVDVLLVVTSCNEEFRESRLERYLALATEAGVTPVIVLTKADLSDAADSYAARARRVQTNVPVELVNARDKGSLGGVKAWIEAAGTIALVGSSGVGKSTLLNTLAESELSATSEIREDDKKGRHTTTHRALHRIPGVGLLIDVPGMRELKIAEVDTALAAVFDDIEAIASACRFSDCRHESEPGCAVRKAVAEGAIDARRLRNYRKLLRENERHNASLAERRSQDRALGKHYRRVMAEKKDERKQR